MIDARSALRLLKSKWTDPTDLARELYAGYTSRQPRTIDAPITIRAPSGQTALRITRDTPEPAVPKTPRPTDPHRPTPPGHTPIEAEPNATTSDTPRKAQAHDVPPSLVASTSPWRSPHPDRHDSPVSDITQGSPYPPPATLADSQGVGTSPPTNPKGVTPPVTALSRSVTGVTNSVTPDQGRHTPARPTPVGTTPRPRFADETPPQSDTPRGDWLYGSGAPTLDYARAYEDPVVKVDGPVAFSGPDPVQFDTPPRVFDKQTRSYRPISDYAPEDPTHIPEGRQLFISRIGQVKSGTGATWTVTIYPDGQPPTSGAGSSPTNQFDVKVNVLRVTANHAAPVGDWITPVVEFNDPNDGPDCLYYFLNVPKGSRIAKTRGGGIPAIAAGIPGNATCDFYTWDGSTALSIAEAVTVYHLGSTAVAASAFIQVAYIEGRPFAYWEDCP